jgi:hypothetical protein
MAEEQGIQRLTWLERLAWKHALMDIVPVAASERRHDWRLQGQKWGVRTKACTFELAAEYHN